MTQEVETLITDEMRASVGVESEPTILEVDNTGIRMFARAGLTEIALRLHDSPLEALDIIGRHVVPALR